MARRLKKWVTYILLCADATLYVGSTSDLVRRVGEHNTSKKGARYTRARRPVALKYSEKFYTRSEAAKREWEIKNLNRKEKMTLCTPVDSVRFSKPSRRSIY